MDARGIQAMFSGIARRYDLVNDLISLGQHRLWKRRAVTLARYPAGGQALDLCTGTGDLSLLSTRAVGPGGCVFGIDFCVPMLEIARCRGKPIHLLHARAESLPFADARFDACTVSFGLRNVSDLDSALREVFRVLKPGGRLVSLDCSTPESALFRPVFDLFFFRVVPLVGQIVAGSRDAYTYLPNSVRTFPQKEEMCARMRGAGFRSVCYYQLGGGSVAIHLAEKAPLVSPS